MEFNDENIKGLLHNVQLENVILTELNCIRESGLRGKPEGVVSVKLSMESGVVNIDNDRKQGTSFLKATIKAEERFIIVIKYEGDFKLKAEVDFNTEEEKKQLEYFLEIQAIPMLLSYVRETIDLVLLKMNEEGARMPIINVDELIKEHLLRD